MWKLCNYIHALECLCLVHITQIIILEKKKSFVTLFISNDMLQAEDHASFHKNECWCEIFLLASLYLFTALSEKFNACVEVGICITGGFIILFWNSN